MATGMAASGGLTPRPVSGAASDLLLGAGGAYLLSVPLAWLVARDAGAGDWPFAAFWAISILVNGPHYGATLLRVYQEAGERRKYARFAVGATLALALVFVAGVHVALVGSLLVTLYFSWSPWHFAAQNYGIALMFLGRAGVRVEPRAKRWLQASFALSFALTLLALHAAGSASVQAPTRDYAEPELLRLGIPLALARTLSWLCGAAYLTSLAAAFLHLRRRAGARQLLPVAALVLLQALWFAVPSALDLFQARSGRGLAFAAIWISGAHSLQYLWVTFHYARRRRQAADLPGYWLKATLAGNAAFVLPGVAFAPGLLGGELRWEAGLSALVFALVNIHHFVLDGAVWKLRDAEVGRALLGDGSEGGPAPARRPGAAAAALWAVFGLCLGIEVAELARQQAERAGNHRASALLLDGLERLGREHAPARIRLGRALLVAGDHPGAAEQFARSLRADPSVAGWGGLGRARGGEGDWRGAAEAYEAGLALAPDDAALLRSAGMARLRLGESGRAAELLTRALERDPGHGATRRALNRALRDSPRAPKAQ